jgi:hypothetical protein
MTALVSTAGVPAAVRENPYLVIAERNVFRLKPFPVQTHIVEQPPPKPAPKILVTGITDICGRKQVLAEITEVGQPTVRPVLAEGESFGAIEVLQIDVEQSHVKVRIQGDESELKLQTAQQSPAAPPPPVLAARR